MPLRLTNPHAVLAALAVRPQDVVEVSLSPRGASGAWSLIAEQARQHEIPVVTAMERVLGERRPWAARGPGARDEGEPPKEGRSGVACAIVREREPREAEEVLAGASGRGLWLALDQVQDPRNVGATFRAAAFFGVRGVLLTRDRSAPLSAVAYDAAAGGLEHVPFAQPPNLARALEQAKAARLWILGAAEDAERDVGDVDQERPWLLVLGGEEDGLRRLTRERCDELCRITPKGPIGSLNVSVAAAVLLSALTR